MARQLIKLFEFARAAAGPTASMRLAMKSMVSAEKAATLPDTPETVAKVRAAIREITGKDAPTV